MLRALNYRTSACFLLLFLLVFVDVNTNFELNLAPLYLLPIVVFSYREQPGIYAILGFSLLASSLSIGVDYSIHPYKNELFRDWNWALRILVAAGVAVASNKFYVERVQRKVIASQKVALEKINAELKESNDQLNRFIGVAAHDIRNPVGSIQMMAEMMLEEESLTEEQKENLRMIYDTAAHSLLLLNDTLNVSKIQSGTINLKKEKQDYLLFLKENIGLLQHLAAKKKQTVLLDFVPEQVWISFDKNRMSQVINNLLTNAIKYSEKNTKVKVRVTVTDKQQLLTEVIDQGLGIDEKFHARIFDPFATTDNQPTAHESKTGLGLAIAKKMVELHNGSIGFTSEKGKGSDFYFYLPMG